MKSKRPSDEVIAEYLNNGFGRVNAARCLRDNGYKFRTNWFLERCDVLEKKEHTAEPAFEEIVDEDDEEEEALRGQVESQDKRRESLPAGVHIFTSAQSNTLVHDGFWAALGHLAEMRDADIHVARFTYNKGSVGKKSVKPNSKKSSDKEDLWFDPVLDPYVSDVSLEVAPDLVWCGELNILPTRINPLSSFVSYTRSASAIIPHAKIAMQSVPTMKAEPAKFLYSTGAVTLRNYIQKTAGQVADFHHVFGALIVEVEPDGTWFARQINADDQGTFIDLYNEYSATGVRLADRPIAINHGDIHWNKRDQFVLKAMFEECGILDKLWPKNQFFHDTIDFQARNHHNIKDPHFLHEMMLNGTDSVQKEFTEAGRFLAEDGHRDWCQSYVVESNHDMAIDQWLRNPVGQYDPKNAETWHLWNARAFIQRRQGQKPRPFANSLTTEYSKYAGRDDLRFLHEDDSLRIKGIEFGLHGHLGPNGARGAPKNLRSVGKANTGHTHSAGIVDGVYTAGVFGELDMGYNKGLSSWSHSFILTYANGKRTIITMKNGKAWA